MNQLKAYFRLMRFHQPLGIPLLWAPTAWALWIVNRGAPSMKILSYFLMGTLIMRAAGCVINDIADRHIDNHVARTRHRPLTAGNISMPEAVGVLLGLLILALVVVMQLPVLCFYEALGALLLTEIYPFCKRYIQTPQLVLGLAFSMGIPIAYAAANTPPDGMMALLFITNAMWIVMYDTMYAMMDREDDLLIGVKSTAILFGAYDRFVIGVLQVLVHGSWLFLGWWLGKTTWFYVLWTVGLVIMCYQQQRLKLRNSHAYFQAFAWSAVYGLVMWVGLF